jgi:hypothetical protein
MIRGQLSRPTNFRRQGRRVRKNPRKLGVDKLIFSVSSGDLSSQRLIQSMNHCPSSFRVPSQVNASHRTDDISIVNSHIAGLDSSFSSPKWRLGFQLTYTLPIHKSHSPNELSDLFIVKETKLIRLDRLKQ